MIGAGGGGSCRWIGAGACEETKERVPGSYTCFGFENTGEVGDASWGWVLYLCTNDRVFGSYTMTESASFEFQVLTCDGADLFDDMP